MKIVLTLFLLSFINGFILREKPHPRKAMLSKLLSKHKGGNRKLGYLDDLGENYGEYSLGQMDNTNTNVYEMQSHNRRNAQLRQVGSWFGDVDLSVDDFRDSVSQKLDQLNMSLQRPKIPAPAFGPGMPPSLMSGLAN